MTPRKYLFILLCIFLSCTVNAQQSTDTKKNYQIIYHLADKDSSFDLQQLKLEQQFNEETKLISYINNLPVMLASKGYPIASIDSSWQVQDSFHLSLYIGVKYNLVQLNVSKIEKKALEESGYRDKQFLKKPVDFVQLQSLQNRLLSFYERQGYPFASVFLDSVEIQDDKLIATLMADKGVLYHVDSLRIIGKAKLNNRFLQRYLYIPNGAVYDKERLTDVDRRILELPYVTAYQASDVTMLGTGSVLNLYLNPKRSSQVNFIVGFLPASGNTGKLQVTGDVNLDLKNILGGGESILVKWQQLQPKSPRLNLGFTQPYVFKSAFGFNFLFDLFKKDSSFLQVNGLFGIQYLLSPNKTGKIFIQTQNTSLLSGGIDTNRVISQKKLPVNIDVSSVSVGLNYEWVKTNYRLNPRSGNEFSITASLGIRKVKPNNDIVNIKDPSFNYSTLYDSIEKRTYQLRAIVSGAHYLPLGKNTVWKSGLNAGIFSSPAIFRNELFQIGGNKLLRGFDEESIYATRYAVVTNELRYLIGLNSYLSLFADYGLAKNKYQGINLNNQYVGGGIGLVFEAKLGLINISYAVGKRNDIKFNLRESSKLHFGYVNYF